MSNLVNIIFKGVALAMGIAVVVLSILNQFEAKTMTTMLGIGLACLAIPQMTKKEEKISHVLATGKYIQNMA